MNKTKDYSIFKKNAANRDMVESNVLKIMNSIKQRNLLEFRPILVNEKMEIIDGQHRLEACKRLGIEVCYIIQSGASDKDMYLLNENQRSWSTSDYLNYFCAQEKEEYIKLRSFMKKTNLKVRDAMTLLTGKPGGKDYYYFKKGEYKHPVHLEEFSITKLDNFKIFCDFIRIKTVGNKNYLNASGLLASFCSFLNIKEVNFQVFMKKLEIRLDLFRPCTKVTDYLNLFKLIYNYRNQAPVSFDSKVRNSTHENNDQLSFA